MKYEQLYFDFYYNCCCGSILLPSEPITLNSITWEGVIESKLLNLAGFVIEETSLTNEQV